MIKRELEEELKNECFIEEMKRIRIKEMDDFFHNEDWCYEKDENENMIFYIDDDRYDDECIKESIHKMINQFGYFVITEITEDIYDCGDECTKVSTTLPFELFSNEFFQN
jgi:hypothetical protein